jgi:putative ABC transport system permease protein
MRDLPRRFVAFVSRLAPGAARREFCAEWEAELSTDPSMRRALGALPDAWYLFRQQWSLDMLTHDVRYALRLMRQRPGYTLLVIATLALGIGAGTAMFSAIHGVLLRPLPFREPARLVMVWENDRLNRKPRYPVAPANFDDWRNGTETLSSVAGWIPQEGTLGAGAEPFHANSAVVTINFLDTLGVAPALGRAFTPNDRPPAQHVLILSHAAWMTHFGGDPSVIERSFRFGDTDYRVVGVMPAGFDFPDRSVDVWRPLAERPELMATRAQHFMFVVARLKPAFTVAQAAQDLERIAGDAQRKYPETNDRRGATVMPLQEAVVGAVRAPLYYLGAAVGLLLLIACANIANLMLAQASTRRREMAVRAALGAGRLRMVRQLLIEGLLLALLSGAAGLALAWQATHVIGRLAVDYVPRVAAIGLDPAVLVFTVAVSIATGLLFTLVPALRASRPDVQRDLRAAGRGATPQGRRLRDALVVIEFAAAVVLVAGGALLLESFWRVLRVNPGFTTERVVTVDPELAQARYGTDAAIAQFYVDLLARLTTVPGLRAAAAINNIPLGGQAWTSWLTIENRPRPSGEPPEVGYRAASPGYLAAMQIPLLHGRWIADSDTATSMKVVVVNQSLADRFFPSGDAVGSRIRLGPNPKAAWKTIVGVIGNVHHAGPETEPSPEAFEAFAQDPFAATVVVRSDLDRAATVAAVRSAVAAVDPAVVVAQVRWLDTLLDERLAPRRLSMWLVEGFAGVALALALLGIYGVISYTVAQRVPEFGVRIALGAAPPAIHRMVLGDGLRLALPGLAIGAAIALVVARLARSLLFGVSPADPATFVFVAGLMLAVSTLACYLPARRAARVDPVTAIRNE